MCLGIELVSGPVDPLMLCSEADLEDTWSFCLNKTFLNFKYPQSGLVVPEFFLTAKFAHERFTKRDSNALFVHRILYSSR